MLNVIYSNDTRRLAGRLAERLQEDPLPPLMAETVMVQSNELARWLNLFLATRHGIAAHIAYPYPSAYIWSLFRQIWPDIPSESPYSTDAMAWRLFALLPTLRTQGQFAPIDRYLGEEDDPRKRLDLAQRIADSFDQYLMYRPDWITQWESGQTPHWQAALWQRLTEGDPQPMHRARLLQRLRDILASNAFPAHILPPRLSLFGLSALPPVYLQLFADIARFTDVDIYFLSPSDSYWGDLSDGKSAARQRLLFDEEVAGDVGHPLLASLGKLGRTFFEQLQDCEHEAEFLYAEPATDTLLGQLKHDIYHLDASPERIVISTRDDSLQVHSCHGPVREVEVLHDQLLDLFERHPGLSPTDVLVMTPDIETYAPAIEAVFSSQPEARSIPYSIASRGNAMQQSVLTAFSDLLTLPRSRFDAESIMGLLECIPVQRRFGFEQGALALIRDWIRDAGIRWGLSAEHRQAQGLPAANANTWRFGLDRLLLGYALPPGNGQWQLFNGQSPVAGVSGERAQIMARLNAFIDCLSRLCDELGSPRSPAGWQELLNAWLGRLFHIDEEGEQLQLDAILRGIDQLAESAGLAGFDSDIDIDLVCDWLSMHIDMPGADHRFMGRGLTFCDMVPMRSIPFDVVCLIGLNDASYPRSQPVVGFDLLAGHPRPGDRSRRDDDRYLFLEAILSADRHLYLSHVGASIHDNAVIPPSVLVSDLREVLQQRFKAEDGGDIWEQLLTRHPLQAFSRRYFDGRDAGLQSFNDQACPPAQKIAVPASWFDAPLPQADDDWRFVSLDALIRFFSHPARFLAQQRLGLNFESDDVALETREPFTLDGLEAWSLRQQLLDGRLRGIEENDIRPAIAACGVLPQGHFAELLLGVQLEQVDAFSEKLQPLLADAQREPLPFEFDCEGFTLTGQLEGLSSAGLLHYRMAKMKSKDLLALWLSHLVLNCLRPHGVTPRSRLLAEDRMVTLAPVEDAPARLADLLLLYWQGLHAPLSLFPESSLAYAQAELGGKHNAQGAALKVWQSDDYRRGEDSDPYHRLLFAPMPLDETFGTLALRVYQPIWQAMEGESP